MNEVIGAFLACGCAFVLGWLLAADHYASFYQKRANQVNKAKQAK